MIMRMFNVLLIDLENGVQKKYSQYCCVSGTNLNLQKRTEKLAVWINETGESLDRNEVEDLRRNKDEFIEVNEE